MSESVRPTAQSWYALICAQVAQAHEPAAWRISAPQSPAGWWIELTHARARRRSQGWKLHLSASVVAAPVMLARVLPLLLEAAASFKLIAAPAQLHALNVGLGGFSQIGKFITIYPNDDEQAVRLAAQLHALTHDLRGPAIASDRALTPGSRVFYRYGAFAQQWLQTADGALHPAIRTPEAELVPDPRESGYAPPSWARDPFLAAGIAQELPAQEPLLRRRYLVIELLAQGPSGAVARALDLAEARTVVLKRAARDAAMTLDGHDARDRLRHEAALLRRLAPNPHIPAVFELAALGDDLCLIMEDVLGETLARTVRQALDSGQPPRAEQVIGLGRRLVAAVESLHRQGLLHRDLKSTNVIVTEQQELRLLDFETAYDLAQGGPLHGLATRGYQSPQQQAGAAPQPADDQYSIGALLFLLATGVEPGYAPDPRNLLRQPIRLLNPTIAPELAALIERCLAPQPEDRYPSLAALEQALADLADRAEPPPPLGSELHADQIAQGTTRYRSLARQLGARLGRAIEQSPAGPSSAAQSRHLYDGLSGQVLALAELVLALDDPQQRAMLARAAERLQALPAPPGPTVAGLYIGEAGVAAALLRAGQALADRALLQAAAQRATALAEQPHTSPTLLSGTAGRLRLHLWLSEALDDPTQLAHARAAGQALLASARGDEMDGLHWLIDSGQQPEQALCGYGLGAAGISDALLDLYEATGDRALLDAVQAVVRWLARQARPALQDGSGRIWPEQPDGASVACTWQHGTTGIGRFLLHASAHGIPHAADLAAGAARLAARGARWAGPAQASGLAGSIELLLDIAQATGERAYLAEAFVLARLLEPFLAERSSQPFSLDALLPLPDGYMLGQAGIALCLLRLADPLVRPHQLSRHGFADRPAPGGRADPAGPAAAQASAWHSPA